MTTKQYTEQMEKSKNRAMGSFDNLTALERDIINSSFEWLMENVPMKGGKFVVTEDLNRVMANFVNAVVEMIESNGTYQNSMKNYLSDLRTISTNMSQYQRTTNQINFEKAGVNEVQKVLVQETINQFTDNGLNQGFVQPLRDLMMRNIVAGISLADAKKVLNEYILSGKDTTGKLSRYLQQTAQQGVDAYTGAINTKLSQQFTFTGYTISGSIIATSSKQCRHAVELSKSSGGYLTNAQWKVIMKEAENNPKATLIEGTTLENLPINKLHWGCRHEFTPTIKN